MKDLDKIIIGVLFGCLLTIIIYGFIVFPILTGQIIGGIFMLGYGLFLFLHIALCYPSAAIGFIISDNYDVIYNKLKKHSIIIAESTRAVIVLLGIILTHLIWLYIACGLIINSFDINDCLNLILKYS